MRSPNERDPCHRLNTFLELKIENERLRQRLRDAKVKEAELDRLEAKNQGLSALTLAQPPPYAGGSGGGGGHARASTIPPTQLFAWTPGSAAGGLNGSFDSRQPYAGGADVSAGDAAGGSGGLATGLRASPGASASVGEPTDPSADHTLPRKKVSLAR